MNGYLTGNVDRNLKEAEVELLGALCEGSARVAV